MKKKILSLFLAFTLILSMMTIFASAATNDELAQRIVDGMAEKTYAGKVEGRTFGYDNWVCSALGMVTGSSPATVAYFDLFKVALSEDGNNIKYEGYAGALNITFVFVEDAVVRIECENIAPAYAYYFPTSTLYPNKYNVVIDSSIQNGTVAVKNGTKVFDAGSSVLLTVTPNDGYVLESLTYTPLGGEPVDITEAMRLTMPSNFVTVTAVFEQDPDCAVYTVAPALAGFHNTGIQSITDENGIGTMQFGWTLTFGGSAPTSLGALIINWEAFDPELPQEGELVPAKKPLELCKADPNINSGDIFFARLTDIPAGNTETITAYPTVNGEPYSAAKLSGTVSGTIILD